MYLNNIPPTAPTRCTPASASRLGNAAMRQQLFDSNSPHSPYNGTSLVLYSKRRFSTQNPSPFSSSAPLPLRISCCSRPTKLHPHPIIVRKRLAKMKFHGIIQSVSYGQQVKSLCEYPREPDFSKRPGERRRITRRTFAL